MPIHQRSRSNVSAGPRRDSLSPSSSTPITIGVDMLAVETEQEAIFNKMQREIIHLKDRRGSQSEGQGVGHFRRASISGSATEEYGVSPTSTTSVLSGYMPTSVSSTSLSSVSSNLSYQDQGRQFERRGSFRRASVCGEDYEKLKQENEILKNKLRDLTLKLADKDHELEKLKSLLKETRS